MPNPKANAPNFTLHTPNAQQLDRQHAISAAAQIYAQSLVENCPPGVEQENALNFLRTSMFWGNWGVTSSGQSQGAGR
jgi:hypothetical protein